MDLARKEICEKRDFTNSDDLLRQIIVPGPNRALANKLLDCVLKLDDELRVVVLMKYFGEIEGEASPRSVSQTEMAKILSVNEKTIRRRLNTARERLRVMMSA